MNVSILKDRLEARIQALYTSSDIEERMEKTLGRPLKDNDDEQEAVMKIIMGEMNAVTKEAIEGKEDEMYTLTLSMSSYDVIGQALEKNPLLNNEKTAELVKNVPELIGFKCTGIFSPDKGFYGTMEYDDSFISGFLKPFLDAIASTGLEERTAKGLYLYMQNMASSQYVFQTKDEMNFAPPHIKSLELKDATGVVVTDTFEGFNKFLDSRAMSGKPVSKEELLAKIQNQNKSDPGQPFKPTI